jgi:hypothetical protein
MATRNLDFAQATVEGLARLGPLSAFRGDLVLELGLSVWLRQHDAGLQEATAILRDLRAALLELGGQKGQGEPIPLLGSSHTHDVINLAHEVSRLLLRRSGADRTDPMEVAAQVVERLECRPAYLPATADSSR